MNLQKKTLKFFKIYTTVAYFRKICQHCHIE